MLVVADAEVPEEKPLEGKRKAKKTLRETVFQEGKNQGSGQSKDVNPRR